MDYFRLDGKLRLAQLCHAGEEIARLQSARDLTAANRDSLKAAFAQHQAAAHPPTDIALI